MLHFCNFHMQCSNDTRRITIHNESTSKALRVLNGGSRAKLSILNSSCFFPEGYRNVRCFFFLFCLTWYLHSSATSPTVWKEKTTTQQKTLFASPLSILQEVTAFKRIELLWFYPQRKRSKHTMQVIAAFQKKNISIIHLFGLVTNYSASPQQRGESDGCQIPLREDMH